MCVNISEILILPSGVECFLSLVHVFTALYLQLHRVRHLVSQLSTCGNNNSSAICFLLQKRLNCMKLSFISGLSCLILSFSRSFFKNRVTISKLLCLDNLCFLCVCVWYTTHLWTCITHLTAAGYFCFPVTQLTYHSGTFPLFPKYECIPQTGNCRKS